MYKIVSVDDFSDGVAETEFLCTEIPIAGGCGSINREYYFFYLLYRCAQINWGTEITIQAALDKMGILLKQEQVANETDLWNQMIEKINRGLPVILPLNYHELYFSVYYKKMNNVHLILVNGYNTENNLAFLRMSPHVYWEVSLNRNVKEQTGLYPVRMRKDILLDLWKRSNALFKGENERTKDSFYYYNIVDDSKFNSLYDVIIHIFLDMSLEHSNLLKAMQEYEYIDERSLRDYVAELRLYYEKFMVAFFDILKKLLVEAGINTYCTVLDSIRDDVLDTRNQIITAFHKEIWRSQMFDKKRYESLVKNSDCRLGSFMDFILKELRNCNYMRKISSKLIHAVTASSEYHVSEAANNILKNDDSIWRSNNLDSNHWIKMDFKKEIVIKKVVIWHDSNNNKLTRAFEILSSNDGSEWRDVLKVDNNSKCISVHYVKPTKCNSLKILVQRPGLLTKQARIKRIEIYGE